MRFTPLGILCAAGFFLSGCGREDAAMGEFATPVRTAMAQQEAIQETITLVGNVLAEESVDIRPEISGLITALHFSEGDPVKAGELLVQIADEKLKAQLAEAEANLELAQSSFERSQQLMQSRSVSKQEFDEASSRLEAGKASANLVRRQVEETQVRAPFDGVSAARRVSPGQYVDPSTVITTLVKLTPVKVQFQVPERFLSTLETGQTIQVQVAAFPNEKFEGEVYFISPSVDEGTRTVEVRARVPNENRRLKPGMFASLELILSVREDGVVIPEEALTIVNTAPAVFVVEEGVANLRNVETGIRLRGKVEIVKGVSAGEEVITAGLQKVRPGGKVSTGGPAAPPAS